MMKSVLKTLAISFGGGLALGAGMRLAQGSAKGRSEPRVDLDPLLARLKNVESRIVVMESTGRVAPVASVPAAAVFAEKTLAAFESRLAAQLTDVEQLRGEIRYVDERLGALDVQLPVLIQSTVDVRFREVEQKLQRDFEEAQSRSMAAFVETLQTKVVERISTLETNLAEQSQVIGTLRDASVRSDENLQKMLAGIERLVDQSKAPPPAPAASPPPPPEPVVEPVGRAQAVDEYEPPIAGVTLRERSRSNYEVRSFPARQVAASLPIVEERKAEEPAPEQLICDTSQLEEIAPGIAVLGCVPEIAHAGVSEAAHANGAMPEPVAQPSLAVTESHAPDSVTGSQPPVTDGPVKSDESYEWVNRIGLELLAPRPKPRKAWRVPLAAGLVTGLILIVGLLYSGVFQRYFDSSATPPHTSTLASTAPASESSAAPQGSDNKPVTDNLQALEQRAASQPADPASLVELAREYQRRKDWSKAESAYRSALEAGPGNRDAALGLSDVLYQQQKYEESAAVLNKISSEKSR
jgi:uncharacterized coiled-coil protein SlyX/predicted negative regulator of RcsB-dependent stress response